MMVGRTELERRGNYMQQIHRLLREGHPLIQMIQRCLKNRIRERPTIHAVLEFLEQARAEVQDGECDMSKLELVQTLKQKTQLIQAKDERIERREGENQSLSQVIRSRDDEILTLSQQLAGKDKVIRSKEGEIQELQSSLDSRLQQIQSLQAQLKRTVEVYNYTMLMCIAIAILLIIYHYKLSFMKRFVSFHFLSSSCYLQSVKSVQKPPSRERTTATPVPVVSIT